jgi:hypothetical protein
MRRWLTVLKIFLLNAFFISSYEACAQNIIADSSSASYSFQRAVELYHHFLSPERGLYNGSEYAYNAYYPFTINEGHPFFQSKGFDTGSVFYDGVLYENVPLLFDIVKLELLTHDPTNNYIMRLNGERVEWFTIWGHTFIRLSGDPATSPLHTGFYDLLYNGKTALYKRVSKIFKENSSSFQGLKIYPVESNEYFIKSDNRYYSVKNKTSLLLIMGNKKKAVAQFMKKNKLKLRTAREYALIKIVSYYDGINNNNTEGVNR